MIARREYDHTRNGAVRVAPDAPNRRAIIAVVLLAVVCSCAAWTVFNRRLDAERETSAALRYEVGRLEDLNAKRVSEISGLKQQARDAELAAAAIAEDLEQYEASSTEATIAPQSYPGVEDELITVAWAGEPMSAFTDRTRPVKPATPGVKPRKRMTRLQRITRKRTISQADTRYLVAYWCKRYHVGAVKHLQDAAVDIIFIGAAESHGNTRCVYGGHVGILQYTAEWGSARQRRNPSWSIRRFVKCYGDSGDSGLMQHWGATLHG